MVTGEQMVNGEQVVIGGERKEKGWRSDQVNQVRKNEVEDFCLMLRKKGKQKIVEGISSSPFVFSWLENRQ